MTRMARGALAALGLGLALIGGTLPAAAGSDDGNFQVRVLGTVVDPDTDATVSAGGRCSPGQRRCQHRGHPGADAQLLPQPEPRARAVLLLRQARDRRQGDHRQSRRDRRHLDLPAGSDPAIPLHQPGQVRALCRRRRAIHQFLRHRHRRQCARRDQGRYRPGLGLHAASGRRHLDRQWLVAQRRRQEDLARHHDHLAQQCRARRSHVVAMPISIPGSSRPVSATASISARFSAIALKPPR